MKERIHYIDVAKGLLILIVVANHMSLSINVFMAENLFAKTLNIIEFNSWVLFFMPTFFIITGLCTNFDKPFKIFLIDNIISLKIPTFFFIGVLGALSIRPIFGFSPFSLSLWFIRMFESGVWFLHALFISKLLYWIIERFMNNWTLKITTCLVLYAVGFMIIMNDAFNYGSYIQSVLTGSKMVAGGVNRLYTMYYVVSGDCMSALTLYIYVMGLYLPLS